MMPSSQGAAPRSQGSSMPPGGAPCTTTLPGAPMPQASARRSSSSTATSRRAFHAATPARLSMPRPGKREGAPTSPPVLASSAAAASSWRRRNSMAASSSVASTPVAAVRSSSEMRPCGEGVREQQARGEAVRHARRGKWPRESGSYSARPGAPTATHLESEAALPRGRIIGAGPLQPTLDGLEDELLPGEERHAEEGLHRSCEGKAQAGTTAAAAVSRGGCGRAWCGAQLAHRAVVSVLSERRALGARERATRALKLGRRPPGLQWAREWFRRAARAAA